MKHLPNFLTCCNLVCGCLGIIALWTKPDLHAAYFVWAACVFDFLDGFSARILKISSPIGKELDSLADVISFGLLPSLFMYVVISDLTLSGNSGVGYGYLHYVAILIAVCSAIRLAVFNIDETQSDSFRGLPTPANAIFITSLPFLEAFDPNVLEFMSHPLFLAAICVVFSLLLVSRIELFALKFKSFNWSDNKLRFTFLLLSVLLLAVLQAAALPLIIILYITLSLAVRVFSK